MEFIVLWNKYLVKYWVDESSNAPLDSIWNFLLLAASNIWINLFS